jgi:serine/threonine-protein kinase
MQEITPVRWRRIESLLDELLELPTEARADHLDRVCSTDDELRSAVERLLAADDEMERSADAASPNPAAAIIAHLSRGALGTLGLDLGSQLQHSLGDAYRIERELPPGGMGRLFLASESSIARKVVIKVLPPQLASATTAARFRREMEVAARLQHPHILPVLQAAARDELLYYVMPYVQGQSLRHLLSSDGPVDVARGVRLIAEIADALGYAHGQGIVHRDVKPENILLAGEHAMLTDFGVARAIAGADDHQSLTATGASLGTPGYMAPEQITGSADIDGRADIYALGVVGYEILAGSRPFAAVTPAAEIGAQISTVAPPLSQKRADIPSGVSDAIQRVLATDPNARFQTAAEFRDALLMGTRSAASRSRLSRPATIGAAGAVALVILAALLFWPRTPATASNPRNSFIVFPFRGSLNDPASAWLEAAASNLIGLSLSHWQELRVYDDERTASLLRRAGVTSAAALDFDVAQKAARQAGVGTMILGDIARIADSLVITAKVHDVRSGERIATEIVRGGSSNDPRPLFDSIVTRVLRLSDVARGVPSNVVANTTHSLEAYRAYLEGTREMSLGAGPGRDQFEKAIALDSNFALAYVQLANAESHRVGGGDTTLRRALVVRASRLGTKLPPRAKMLVDLQIAMHDKRFTQARRLGAQLTAIDSTDAEAWNWRGEVEMRSGTLTLPRVDSLGDLATEIRYMRRSLELDSTLVGNYGPLSRALVGCASPEAPWVCFRDSTVYGPPHELRLRLGSRTVDSLRAEARQQILPTVRKWMTASANVAAPRRFTLYFLIMLGYVDEAEAQLTRYRLLGGDSIVASVHEMRLRVGQNRVREAASIAAALLRLPPQEIDTRFQPPEPRPENNAAAYLAAAGRFGEARALMRRVSDPASMATTTGDTIPLPDALRRAYIQGTLGAAYTTDARVARESLRAFYSALRNEFVGDWAQMPALVTMNPAPIVAYTQTRDSVILHDWMEATSALPSRGAEALLLLARGDTAGARSVVARFFDPKPFPERALIAGLEFGPVAHFTLEAHQVADAFAWGDALSQLGDRRRAVQAYAKLDQRFLHLFRADPKWLLRVRSWYERGRLYEQLHDTTDAIKMYEQFIDAWRDADAPLQPMVREARAGLARLGRRGRD